MVGGFELAGRLVMGVRAVVKAAVGERAAEPFVKEQEELSERSKVVKTAWWICLAVQPPT
jgi:hypothetical protein